MDLLQFINSLPQPPYCERVSDSLFSEPINLITNLAFFVSAFFVYKIIKASNLKNSIYNFFPWIIFSIGLGSSLWHLYRNPVTLIFDALPVYIFLGLALFVLIKKLIGNSKQALVIIGLFILLQILLTINFPDLLNNSIRHIANAVLLLVLIVWTYKKFGNVALQLIIVLLIYVVGIFFRTIDMSICPIFSPGTHFLWHILVALGAYFIVKFLVFSLSRDLRKG